jgi:hypothetical protein
VATGGQARLVAKVTKQIHHVDEFLTLLGLRLIWEKNMHGETIVAGGAKAKAKS